MFSERLKASRKEVGLTQVELAKILKVSKGTVGMWETGKREPKFEIMGHLSRTLNMSVDYLLGLSENESPPPADKIHSNKGSRLQVQAEVIYSCDDYGVVNNGSVVITRKWSGAPGGGEFHQAARSVL